MSPATRTVGDMADLVLGGLIGLGSALVVQIIVQTVIVPRVQARIRRHDRWEKDLIDLVTLVEEELPRAQRELRFAALLLRDTEKAERDDQGNRERIREWKLEHLNKLRAADRDLGEILVRADRLERRLRLVHRRAPYWSELFWKIARHRVAVMSVEEWRQGELDEDQFHAAWDKVETRRNELLVNIKEVSNDMKPPSQQRLRRAWRWFKRLPKRVRRRVRPAREPETIPPSTGPSERHTPGVPSES